MISIKRKVLRKNIFIYYYVVCSFQIISTNKAFSFFFFYVWYISSDSYRNHELQIQDFRESFYSSLCVKIPVHWTKCTNVPVLNNFLILNAARIFHIQYGLLLFEIVSRAFSYFFSFIKIVQKVFNNYNERHTQESFILLCEKIFLLYLHVN